MKFGFGALAALGLGMLALGATPSLANDASLGAASAQTVTTVVEAGYVTTQGRRRRGRNFNRNVGIGVGALVLGGIIASQSSRASGYGGNSCRRWSYQCDQGAGWACRNFNRNC